MNGIIFRVALLMGMVVVFIINGCSDPKPKVSITHNDISKYENILENFDEMVRNSPTPQLLSYTIAPVENKATLFDNEIITKLKLMPKIELEKMKSVSLNDKSSDIISCIITRFDIFRDKRKEVAIRCSINNKEKKRAKSPQLFVENMIKIATNKYSKEYYFDFNGTGFNKSFNISLPLHSTRESGVDKALKLLVDISLIELISKSKNYHYMDRFENIYNRGIYFYDLEYKDIGYDISIKIPKVFHEDDNISFSIDTKGKEGYIYLLYIDSMGKVNRLYPNEVAPLEPISGIYTFPKDFGNMTIKATKDCGHCKEENTTIYAFFSKKIVLDIDKITANQLLNIPTHGYVSRALCYPYKIEHDLNFCVVNFVVR